MVGNLLFFVQAIPEVTGVIALSLALARVPLVWVRIIPTATVLAVIIFILRSLPIAFGMHMIAGSLLLVVFISKLTTVSPTKSFIVVFASGVTLAFFELLIHEPLFAITKLELEAAITDNLVWTLLGLPQAVLMILMAIIISRYFKPLKDAWRK